MAGKEISDLDEFNIAKFLRRNRSKCRNEEDFFFYIDDQDEE
jgi:hypothetical protein